ncbi:MAG: UDP-N-acetylmuramoyl-tripeptide--D-alanyl-D-alanine ligase [Endomicrobiales bacterium]|nr:UDP-N-acetylmuramoyl-tripeptide--D-alanyl-D-alanine ligase [Endomicrobiales bacterium]
MDNIYIRELVNATRGEFMLGDPHGHVKNISIDTRGIKKGDFFFAISGKNFDGHNFLKQAIDKKAAGLVISRSDVDFGTPAPVNPVFPAIIKVKDTTKALGDLAGYYRKKWEIPVIAVTGSNGKTTTKEMLYSILSKKGPTLSTVGNFNNQIGLPLTLFQIDSSHKYAVVELGTSWPGEIERLTEIAAPEAGIITNIGACHLENFKNKEGVLKEKSSLIDGLPSGGFVVLNADDQYLSRLNPQVETIRYGINTKTNVFAADIKLWPGFPEFRLHLNGNVTDIKLPMYGKFNIYNALAAASCAWKLGMGMDIIKSGIESFSLPKMRMEVTTLVSGAVVINDAYNSNPFSVRESVQSFIQAFPDKNKIVVLGDMLELGSEAEAEHEKLGDFLATQSLSQIFLYGPMMIKAIDGLKGVPAEHYLKKEDLEGELDRHLVSDTVVLFKASRGMHLEEVVENIFGRHGIMDR